MFVELYDSWTAASRALAKVTPAADKLAYFTGQEAAALTDISQLGRSLVGAADAAAARTALQLKALASQDTAAVANGGTGATSARQARTNLGLATDDLDAIPLAKGGTGAVDAAGARANVGLGPTAAPTFAGIELLSGTPFLDFHFGSSTADFTGRFVQDNANRMIFTAASDGVARYAVNGGYTCRTGVSGSYGSSCFNFNWTGSLQAWVDGTNVGNVQLSSSDYRIKKNIKTLTDDFVARIQKYRVVTYQYRQQGAWRGNVDVVQGLIAHEAKEANPLAATGTKDEVDEDGNMVIQNLNTFAIITDLIGAVQQQALKIQELEALTSKLSAK